MNAPQPRLTVEAEPFIPYADITALPDKLKAPLEAYEARMGFLPNALKIMATGRIC
jgi:hypothetical protein